VDVIIPPLKYFLLRTIFFIKNHLKKLSINIIKMDNQNNVVRVKPLEHIPMSVKASAMAWLIVMIGFVIFIVCMMKYEWANVYITGIFMFIGILILTGSALFIYSSHMIRYTKNLIQSVSIPNAAVSDSLIKQGMDMLNI